MFEPGKSARRKRDVWFWLVGVAALMLLALVFFGPAGGDGTADTHPGGAPADTGPEAAIEAEISAQPHTGPASGAGPDAPVAGVPEAAD